MNWTDTYLQNFWITSISEIEKKSLIYSVRTDTKN